MYPYNPQVAALANRYNPQYRQDDTAPLQRQGAPTTSGQIQPAGLQPQHAPMNMRPGVAALARQYNPQFNPQTAGMQNMQDQMQNQFNLGLQQTQNQQPMNLGNQYAQQFGAAMNNPNMDQMQRQMAVAQMQQANQQPGFTPGYANNPQYWNNQQPAYNPGFTQAGQAQNNFLTTPTARAYPAAQPVAGMPQLPMNGYNGAMTQPNYAGYGGGVGGLARFYTR